jgi:hypothetical protein
MLGSEQVLAACLSPPLPRPSRSAHEIARASDMSFQTQLR